MTIIQPSSLLEQVLKELPAKPASDYDGMIVSEGHFARLRDITLPATNSDPHVCYGLTIVENKNVPEGFAVITQRGKPVGIIDFNAGTATLTSANSTGAAE